MIIIYLNFLFFLDENITYTQVINNKVIKMTLEFTINLFGSTKEPKQLPTNSIKQFPKFDVTHNTDHEDFKEVFEFIMYLLKPTSNLKEYLRLQRVNPMQQISFVKKITYKCTGCTFKIKEPEDNMNNYVNLLELMEKG